MYRARTKHQTNHERLIDNHLWLVFQYTVTVILRLEVKLNRAACVYIINRQDTGDSRGHLCTELFTNTQPGKNWNKAGLFKFSFCVTISEKSAKRAGHKEAKIDDHSGKRFLFYGCI